MKDDFDFEDSGLRPTRTYGTRWISHRLNALHKFYDKFKVFVLHLENLIREATMKEKSFLEGVRRKVFSSSVIINAVLFSDTLAPVKDLSIALQNNSFKIVDATTKIIECIDIYKNMLNSLNTDEKFVFRFSYIQKLMRENESETYQNIKITNYARTVDSLTRNAIRYVELIVNCLQNHFKDSTRLMLHASLILNSQVRLVPSQDITYEDMF